MLMPTERRTSVAVFAAGVPTALPAPGALPILPMLSSKLRLSPPGLVGVAALTGGCFTGSFLAATFATGGAVSGFAGFCNGLATGFSIFIIGVGVGGGSLGAVSPAAGGADSS